MAQGVLARVFDVHSQEKDANERLLEYCRITNRLQLNPSDLRNIEQTYRDNKALVLVAVRRNGYALKYASDRLKNTEDVVLEAVKNNGHGLQFANVRLQDNENIATAAVKCIPAALQHASERMRDTEAVVLEAVRGNGLVLKYAGENTRSMKNVVEEAIKLKKGFFTFEDRGRVLEYTDPETRSHFLDNES